MSLASLCEIEKTDKRPSYHDYTRWYGPLLLPLRGRADVRILEIGVSAGASLRVWDAYFPEASLYAIDHKRPAASALPARVTFHQADQAKRADLHAALDAFGGAFDLIIDDGGHRMDEQQVSLATLFQAVVPSGLYIIEDVHTSFPDLHPGYGVNPDGKNSTYAMFDRFARTRSIASAYITASEAALLSSSIAWCSYHFRPTRKHSDLMVFVKR